MPTRGRGTGVLQSSACTATGPGSASSPPLDDYSLSDLDAASQVERAEEALEEAEAETQLTGPVCQPREWHCEIDCVT